MIIGGFQSFSLSEFPGRISAVVFCQGCNFRCPYCHNPELVDPGRFAVAWPEERVMRELASRRDKIQGVVITGGTECQQRSTGLRVLGYPALGSLLTPSVQGIISPS